MEEKDGQLDADIFTEADEALKDAKQTLKGDLHPIQNMTDKELDRSKNEMKKLDANITEMKDKGGGEQKSKDAKKRKDKDDKVKVEAKEFQHDELVGLVNEVVNAILVFLIKEFALLLLKILPEHLIREYGLENNGCLDNAPNMKVKTVVLQDESSKLTEDDCDVAFSDFGD